MAGKNIILKKDQVLFNYGDVSNGMFLVRKGDIKIFMHDSQDNEIVLAEVTAGAMIGEMALFDNKPRSASATALSDCEVTYISRDDFNKIMKQIPKWFVNLMSTLSSRLRHTNEQLNQAESLLKSRSNPLEELQLILNTYNLLWYKHAYKLGKTWVIDSNIVTNEVCEIIGVNKVTIEHIVVNMVDNGIISRSKDSYNADTLVANSRNALEQLCKFITKFRRDNLVFKIMPTEVVDIVNVIARILEDYAYDPATIGFGDIEERAFDLDIRTDTWSKYLSVFRDLDDSIQLVKMGSQLGFKIHAKPFKKLQQNILLMRKFSD